MSNSSTTTAVAAAALVLALAVPAAADTPVHRHRVHHRHVARAIDVAPYGVPLDERGPERYPNNGGEDELGIENGVAAGREDPVPGPRSTGLGLAETQRGPSFEIEGPPIAPSLPVLPYYGDPTNDYR